MSKATAASATIALAGLRPGRPAAFRPPPPGSARSQRRAPAGLRNSPRPVLPLHVAAKTERPLLLGSAADQEPRAPEGEGTDPEARARHVARRIEHCAPLTLPGDALRRTEKSERRVVSAEGSRGSSSNSIASTSTGSPVPRGGSGSTPPSTWPAPSPGPRSTSPPSTPLPATPQRWCAAWPRSWLPRAGGCRTSPPTRVRSSAPRSSAGPWRPSVPITASSTPAGPSPTAASSETSGHPRGALTAQLRPLPGPQGHRPPARPRRVPRLLQLRARPHRRPQPRSHPCSSCLRCQACPPSASEPPTPRSGPTDRFPGAGSRSSKRSDCPVPGGGVEVEQAVRLTASPGQGRFGSAPGDAREGQEGRSGPRGGRRGGRESRSRSRQKCRFPAHPRIADYIYLDCSVGEAER